MKLSEDDEMNNETLIEKVVKGDMSVCQAADLLLHECSKSDIGKSVTTADGKSFKIIDDDPTKGQYKIKDGGTEKWVKGTVA